MSGYTMGITLDTDVADAEQRVRGALQEQGFGILSEIDVQAALREKLGEEIRPYKILGACNPSLASRAIDVDPDVGALLPCNVLLRGNDSGGTDVAAADPRSMLELAEGLDDIAAEARRRISAALEALTAEA